MQKTDNETTSAREARKNDDGLQMWYMALHADAAEAEAVAQWAGPTR